MHHVRKKIVIVSIVMACSSFALPKNSEQYPYQAYVKEAVVDVVTHEQINYQQAAPTAPYHTPNILAQLIYGEQVTVEETNGLYSKITIPSQIIFLNNNWEPIMGWVLSAALHRLSPQKKNSAQKKVVCIAPWTTVYHEDQKSRYTYSYLMMLPFGTELIFLEEHDCWTRVILADGSHACVPTAHVAVLINNDNVPLSELREIIVTRARLFIGMPYCWGGMSPHQPAWSEKLSGFDCSGLMYRIYLSCNVSIPRNSRSQYYASTPCNPSQLQAGDLVFLAHEKITPSNNSIFHVMLYTGEQSLIEAWTVHHKPDYDTQPIREVSVTERLGKPLTSLRQGAHCPQGYYCYFATLLTAE